MAQYQAVPNHSALIVGFLLVVVVLVFIVVVVIVFIVVVVFFQVVISIKSDKSILINPMENPQILFPYAFLNTRHHKLLLLKSLVTDNSLSPKSRCHR